jgi:L-aspartate oxidase
MRPAPSYDFVIVGGGIAGLRAAIGLAAAGRVLVLTKAEPAESNTGYAQGGIAAAIGDDDTPALHAADTIRAGDGLCDEEAVRVCVEEGPRYVHELIAWGARFDRASDGRPALGREAAHSVRRVLHASDATGREIGRVLWERVRALDAVETIDHALVASVLVDGEVEDPERRVVSASRRVEDPERGVVSASRRAEDPERRVASASRRAEDPERRFVSASRRAEGVSYFDADGRRHEVRARSTLLATGGAGQVFRETTNPAVATGDGIALAFHAGARVADLEFVQFHPTALNRAGAPRFLISEALRGEGARLVNERGDPFMTRYHPHGDLAPRDVVARGIAREAEQTGGPVFLTLAHLDPDYVRRRFPTIAEICARIGLDLARDPIPVGPAAHYIMGGVDTDAWGRTSVAALFAAGEVACTGLHGANRLASNSLLEGLVFGARAAQAMQEPARAAVLKPDRVTPDRVPSANLGQRAADPRIPNPQSLSAAAIRDLMWRQVGLFRTRDGLREAVDVLSRAYAATSSQTAEESRHRSLVTVARLIAHAALRREESRGGHYRVDCPARDDLHWRVHVVDGHALE